MSICGNFSSSSLVSCRHIASGRCVASQVSNWGSRMASELTFQVATFIRFLTGGESIPGRANRRRSDVKEGKLSALEKEFNGGEPERHIDEFDFQKYLDRVAQMRSAISRKQIEIAELRREIDKLPTP